MSIAQNGIELTDCLQQLRKDLIAVEQEGRESGIKLLVKKVDIELTLTASKETSGEAGVKWYILSASAGTELSELASQKIKITLCAVDTSTGKRALIGAVDDN